MVEESLRAGDYIGAQNILKDLSKVVKSLKDGANGGPDEPTALEDANGAS